MAAHCAPGPGAPSMLRFPGRPPQRLRHAPLRRAYLQGRDMEIELNDEQNLLRDTVRRFAQEVVKPRAKEIDETGEFPRGFFDQAGELGLAGVAVPEEYGGAGMDTLSYALVIQEVSRVCATSGV